VPDQPREPGIAGQASQHLRVQASNFAEATTRAQWSRRDLFRFDKIGLPRGEFGSVHEKFKYLFHRTVKMNANFMLYHVYLLI
jgi:hypothetical protein